MIHRPPRRRTSGASWQHALAILAPDDLWEAIFSTEQPVKNNGKELKQVAGLTAVGAAMFAAETLKVQCLSFQKKKKKKKKKKTLR
eukprot:NODE_16113_length_1012_cov_1.401130.p3 GENE.NODE_16113_length_1012_cov_1.401130~~NODE_16113_length_1012_cov_1.401130.p3  ORF type:complete len:86 (-),score=29.75 NODE_16113_length_1012_cov_1.401130:71-328(-)